MSVGRRVIHRSAIALLLAAARGHALPAGARRVGLLSIADTYTQWPEWRAFVDELARLGHAQGRDVEYLARHAGTYAEPQLSQRLFVAATDLVARRVDLIYAVEVSATALAARRATQSVPIVFDRSWFDPVETGLVSDLARPGGNLTGNAVLGIELEGKAIETLVETVGTRAPIGVVQSKALRSWPNYERLKKNRGSIGRALGVSLEVIEADNMQQLSAELARVRRQGMRAVKIDDPETLADRREEVAALFVANRMATVSNEPDFARAGLLIGLGWDVEDISRRSAGYVHRVLNGARPGELPVEQVTKYKLVVNRRTARAIEVALPPALLARADEVIE